MQFPPLQSWFVPVRRTVNGGARASPAKTVRRINLPSICQRWQLVYRLEPWDIPQCLGGPAACLCGDQYIPDEPWLDEWACHRAEWVCKNPPLHMMTVKNGLIPKRRVWPHAHQLWTFIKYIVETCAFNLSSHFSSASSSSCYCEDKVLISKSS